MPFEWTNEKVSALKTLWLQGISARQIASRLGEGVSRNAVIGKANRLGLSAPALKVRKKSEMTATPERLCQWPIGHPNDEGFRFCEQPVFRGRPYCEIHCASAYRRKQLS